MELVKRDTPEVLNPVVQSFGHSRDFQTIEEGWASLASLSQHIVDDEKKYEINGLPSSPTDVRLIQIGSLRAILDVLEKNYVAARNQRYSAQYINWLAFSYWV